MPRTSKATPAQIAAAVKALGLTIPVRAAERKGTQIILHTRAGDYAWTLPASRGGTTKKRASK